MNNQYGIVNYEGKELAITQQPYVDGSHEEAVYRASAQDAEGNDYDVKWTSVDLSVEDETAKAHCDWTKYEVTAQ